MEDLFKIRLYKSTAEGGTGKEWQNEYTIQTPEAVPITSPILNTAINDLLTFERSFHSKDVFFERAVVSTAIANDLEPSDAVRVAGTGVYGLAPGLADGQPLLQNTNVMVLTFNGASGRSGRHTYRGALTKNSLNILFGGLQLVGNTRDMVNAGIITLVATTTFPLMRILTNKEDGFHFRPIVSVTIGAPGNRQINAVRKPKISLDEDAMMNRIAAMIKEMALINASITVRNSTTGIDVAKREELLEKIADFRLAYGNFNPFPAA